ncbi:MAG: hypothetical protein KI785_06480 [Devosiaceae bacterium]|nr:hypothetical protein [Devosiaceae bacterium MH13]
MKSFLTKTRTAIAGGIAVLIACVMAGLGLTIVGFLAMFALAALGLALIARPFVDIDGPRRAGPAHAAAQDAAQAA